MKRTGEIFRERRKALELRQEDVVTAAGYPRHNGTLSIIESGREPKFRIACQFAYVLQISPNELAIQLGLKVWDEKKHAVEREPITPEESKIISHQASHKKSVKSTTSVTHLRG